MAIYEYECSHCKRHFEQFHKVSRVPKRARCTCGQMARRVLSTHGAVLTDNDVKWMDSAKQNLPNSAKNIQTRGEWKRYLRDNRLICIG
jgi:putative FmdB family regulatory protein